MWLASVTARILILKLNNFFSSKYPTGVAVRCTAWGKVGEEAEYFT